MLRLLVLETALFLLPWGAWWLFQYVKQGYVPYHRKAPRRLLLILGLLSVLLGLIPFAYYHRVFGTTEVYVPAAVVDGKVVPGHFVK